MGPLTTASGSLPTVANSHRDSGLFLLAACESPLGRSGECSWCDVFTLHPILFSRYISKFRQPCVLSSNDVLCLSIHSVWFRFYTSKCYVDNNVDNNEKSLLLLARKHLFSRLGLVYGVSIFSCGVLSHQLKVINASTVYASVTTTYYAPRHNKRGNSSTLLLPYKNKQLPGYL